MLKLHPFLSQHVLVLTCHSNVAWRYKEITLLGIRLDSAVSWQHRCKGSPSSKRVTQLPLIQAVAESCGLFSMTHMTNIALLPCSQAVKSFWFFAHGICLGQPPQHWHCTTDQHGSTRIDSSERKACSWDFLLGYRSWEWKPWNVEGISSSGELEGKFELKHAHHVSHLPEVDPQWHHNKSQVSNTK